jgi:hypothetical protein
MQRLYKRRKTDNEGNISSNWSVFRSTKTMGNNLSTDDNDPSIAEVIYDGGVI